MKIFSNQQVPPISPTAVRYLGEPEAMSDTHVHTTSIKINARDSVGNVMSVALGQYDYNQVTIAVDDHVKKQLILTIENHHRPTRITRITISAGTDSEVFLVVTVPEADWSHTEIIVDHLGSHARVDIAIVGVVRGSSRAALITRQHHRKSDSSSSLVIKALVDDAGQLMHHGSIIVEPDARLTVARQKTSAILCSDQSRAWSIPTLEVIPHEVSCAHGAAMGPLDDDQIMYAQSRGIPAATARRIILHGFLADALQRLPESYQVAISNDLIDRVSGAQ